jgi:DNA-binding NarL/FixJ family response regulator
MNLTSIAEKLIRLRLHVLSLGPGLPPSARADYQTCVGLLDELLLGTRAEGGGASATGLTPREGQILGLLQHGYSNQQIAVRMGVTAGTVKTYLKSIYSKLGVQNRTQAALSFRPGAEDRA